MLHIEQINWSNWEKHDKKSAPFQTMYRNSRMILQKKQNIIIIKHDKLDITSKSDDILIISWKLFKESHEKTKTNTDFIHNRPCV